jgi:hypothetical protein
MEPTEPVQPAQGSLKEIVAYSSRSTVKEKYFFKPLGSIEEGRKTGNYCSNDSITANRIGSVASP